MFALNCKYYSELQRTINQQTGKERKEGRKEEKNKVKDRMRRTGRGEWARDLNLNLTEDTYMAYKYMIK